MSPDITPLDPADEAAVDAVLAIRTAAVEADVPDFAPPCPYAFRAELAHPFSTKRKEWFVARLDGEPVGYLELALSLREDLEEAVVELCVHPAYRRRGIGRALHGYMARRLRAIGRKRCMAYGVGTLPGGPQRDEAGERFAIAMGAKVVLEEVRRVLDLTSADQAELDRLRDAAAEQAAGYRLVSWRGHTPDEYTADAAYLNSRMVTDAPQGDRHRDPQEPDVTRLREREALLAKARVRVYSTGVVYEESGRLVALTAIGRFESTPCHASQWITLVEPRHRGHRLGMLVKLENLRLARAHEPELRLVSTWNAATNRHMIAINEAIGHRPMDRWSNWQQELF
jgi:GNAT superfamily N-acetyltransferase